MIRSGGEVGDYVAKTITSEALDSPRSSEGIALFKRLHLKSLAFGRNRSPMSSGGVLSTVILLLIQKQSTRGILTSIIIIEICPSSNLW